MLWKEEEACLRYTHTLHKKSKQADFYWLVVFCLHLCFFSWLLADSACWLALDVGCWLLPWWLLSVFPGKHRERSSFQETDFINIHIYIYLLIYTTPVLGSAAVFWQFSSSGA